MLPENQENGNSPTSASAKASHPELAPQTSPQTLCNCSQAMSTLLDDSEKKMSGISVQTTHLALAHIKHVLQHCVQILDCSYCSARSDHMMLAAVVANKIVFVEEDVARVLGHVCESLTHPQSPRHHGDGELQHHTRNQHHHAQYDRYICYDLFIGDYVVDSEVEWAAVVRALIVILSKRTIDMLERMKRIAKTRGRETQVRMLWSAEQRARKVAWSIRDKTGIGILG
ncbi:MAG: hypothetical protein L6R39_007161 [Caloplaca ligustica]|nr:MAG: hypothetical protein L6R39_007161 [Caloplaca ligustica]